MKNLYLLLFVLTSLGTTSLRATTHALPGADLAAAWLTDTEDQRLDRASAEAFAQLTVADVAARNGGELGLGQRMAFVYAKQKVRRQLNDRRHAGSYDAPSGGGGFGGGFALGFFLGLLGVVIALIIRDKKPGRERMLTGAWVGLGVFLVLYIILVVAVASRNA